MKRRSFVAGLAAAVVGGMAAVLLPFAPRRKGQEESEQVEVATPTCNCACCGGLPPSLREMTITGFDGESRRGMMIWDAQRNVWQITQIEYP